jgi:hypothetical protein
MRNQIGMMALLLALTAGCTARDAAGVVVTQEPPGANCAAGGARVQVGTDAPTYVCNGATGENGQSAVVTSEPPGTHCTAGGVKVQVGAGLPTYVCNGVAGAAGEGVAVSTEPAGSNCAAGGVKMQSGANAPLYVCNGVQGAAGQCPAVTAEPPGANCAAGGLKFQLGSFDPVYACNGEHGGSCSVQATGGITALTCADGSSTILKVSYSVGGTVSGLLNGGLLLWAYGPTNGGDLAIEADGAYLVPGFDDGESWTIDWQAPPTMTCSASESSGTVSGESVTWADLSCSCLEGLADCDGDPANRCETTLASDAANCGACGNACTGEATCLAGACTSPARSYDVGNGPGWSSATAYNCVQTCALLFGGAQGDWACSTSSSRVDHYAWYSKLGSSEHCGPTGTPLPEDFATGGPYVTAGYSAWVQDWCFAGEGSINYCHRSTAP